MRDLTAKRVELVIRAHLDSTFGIAPGNKLIEVDPDEWDAISAAVAFAYDDVGAIPEEMKAAATRLWEATQGPDARKGERRRVRQPDGTKAERRNGKDRRRDARPQAAQYPKKNESAVEDVRNALQILVAEDKFKDGDGKTQGLLRRAIAKLEGRFVG